MVSWLSQLSMRRTRRKFPPGGMRSSPRRWHSLRPASAGYPPHSRAPHSGKRLHKDSRHPLPGIGLFFPSWRQYFDFEKRIVLSFLQAGPMKPVYSLCRQQPYQAIRLYRLHNYKSRKRKILVNIINFELCRTSCSFVEIVKDNGIGAWERIAFL